MTLAAVHAPIVATLPIATLLGLWTLWFWWRQGAENVPASRRYIRRTSAIAILCALPAFVRGLSVVDSEIDGALYVQTWIVGMGLLGVVVVTALLDVVNNLRLHHAAQEEEAIEAAAKLAQAIRDAKARETGEIAPPGSGA